MAIRKSEIRRFRRELISRTARVWSRLTKKLVSDLNEITQLWLKKLLKQAGENIAVGDLADFPEFPRKFSKILIRILREALAQSYWLEHIYLQEMRTAYFGRKYHGKITLSDIQSEDENLRDELEKFISSGEWHDIIPKDAVDWLNNYVPKLSGSLSEDILNRTREVIQKSMIEGSTLNERMKALQEAAPELAAMSQRRIESIARTEITRADTMGRLISMKNNSDVIGFEFSAILDDRTTDICSSRHGLFMKIDDPRLSFNTPPQHVNCRSMLLSVTIYEYPDGLLTSTEFDEIPASNQRQVDIDDVRKIIEAEVKPTVIPTIPVKENLVFAAAVSSIEDLRKMFSNNEIPIKIEGSRSEQAQIFEEINRLYPAPSNIMSEYHVDEVSGMASIYFDNNVVRGEDTLIRFPSGRKATENEKSGAIKYAIYKHRPRLELAALCRRGGFATFDMAEKYGGRFLTDIEKAAVNSEMNAYILKLFGTPLSEEGQKANESHWVKGPGGWKRSGDVF